MDIDQLARAMKDLEYRIKQLEKAQWRLETVKQPTGYSHVYQRKPWCACGRDVCRAPECPSHKPDPMGR